MEESNKYYSQHGQDKWLYETYFKEKTDGIFMEIGCIDGVQLSNSLFFENLGWSGICIEASPSMFERMVTNRKCICENVAVSDYVGTTNFLDINGYSEALSGIVEDYHPTHQHRIQSEMRMPNNKSCDIINVKVDLLNNILESHDLYHIDFATVDTEGSEFNILNAFDFNRFNIDIFLIENNYQENNVRSLMIENNYEYIGSIQQDDIFVKKH